MEITDELFDAVWLLRGWPSPTIEADPR